MNGPWSVSVPDLYRHVGFVVLNETYTNYSGCVRWDAKNMRNAETASARPVVALGAYCLRGREGVGSDQIGSINLPVGLQVGKNTNDHPLGLGGSPDRHSFLDWETNPHTPRAPTLFQAGSASASPMSHNDLLGLHRLIAGMEMYDASPTHTASRFHQAGV